MSIWEMRRWIARGRLYGKGRRINIPEARRIWAVTRISSCEKGILWNQ